MNGICNRCGARIDSGFHCDSCRKVLADALAGKHTPKKECKGCGYFIEADGGDYCWRCK